MSNTPKPSLLMKLFKILAAAMVLVTIGAGVLLWYSGAWNIVFPSSHHDTQAPKISADLSSPAIIVFSKTNSFRHVEGIEGGQRAIKQIAKGNGWGIFLTENGAVFNPQDLNKFSSVVFLNASGDMLNEAQEQAFQQWLEAGGGWVGIHAAGDDSHAGWQWYGENLIGVNFTAHIMGPQFQSAKVIVDAPTHPIANALPKSWSHTEEWYSWDKSPRASGFNVVAVLDEQSYTPEQNLMGKNRDLRMGDHPVVWSNCIKRGRAVYSALGHTAEAFEQTEHKQLLENAIGWSMGLTGDADECE